MLAKELYKVGATRVGLQKINPKRETTPTQRPRSISASSLTLSKKVSKKKKCQRKDHFFAFLQNQNALLHAFARFFAETTMVKVVVVVGGGGGALVVLISLSTTMEFY
jgi:hypothetical protein